jgi:hypothetical protein
MANEEAHKMAAAGDSTPFLGLLGNRDDLKRVMDRVGNCIWKSFGQDVQRSPFTQPVMTQNEIKRRFRICEQWFRRARGDYGFSMDKTLDLMQHALRCGLDGQDYDPSESPTRLWTPT